MGPAHSISLTWPFRRLKYSIIFSPLPREIDCCWDHSAPTAASDSALNIYFNVLQTSPADLILRTVVFQNATVYKCKYTSVKSCFFAFAPLSKLLPEPLPSLVLSVHAAASASATCVATNFQRPHWRRMISILLDQGRIIVCRQRLDMIFD